MTDKSSVKRKRYKDLSHWFKNDSPSVRESEYQESNNENENELMNIVKESTGENIHSSVLMSSEVQSEKIDEDEILDTTSLERDSEKRHPICKYPVNERDRIRREYVVLGPYQPHLECYPSTYGVQGRKFSHKWFKDWPWLEYSIENDRAYCFPCFLFDTFPSRHPCFTEIGFYGWKNVKSQCSGILSHMGGMNSTHNSSMFKWETLKNPSIHIERVISTFSSQEVANNRLRLMATIKVVKVLARQGCSFRGDDESSNSLNGGNFDAILDLVKSLHEGYQKAIENAPKNAIYTSPIIQKQIAEIVGNKVRGKIREEVGESKFCILVDEALDMANKEQMALILRFVDCKGLIRERFFKVISVIDTCSKTLKNEISKVLAQYDLKEEDMRGQGYDGASNMRGHLNGLQALFIKECPYAYYVHCFAHRLQLTLNDAAKGVPVVYRFFSTLTMIVNFIDSSAKRRAMLKAYREEEIFDLVALGSLGSGSGMNQASTLQRSGATRWGSHFRSISSLIKLFGATRATIDDLCENGVEKVQGEASGVRIALENFDFIYYLHLLHEVMEITDFLSQILQKKDLDILNAMDFIYVTKEKLQTLRNSGWDGLIKKVEVFCTKYDIILPNMRAPYKQNVRASDKNITNEHYFRINVLYVVIDKQMAELDNRFTESSIELLTLSASFNPRDNFRSFNVEDVCKLASKFYTSDFLSHDLDSLRTECGFFLQVIQKDKRFTHMTSISDVGRLLNESGKSSFYPMLYRLICLILTLPVSTATTERAFSSMKIIKNKLRNKMSNDFLNNLMILSIERALADDISDEDVIKEFEMSGPRRVSFS